MCEHRNPSPTVDVIVEITDAHGRAGVVLVHRAEPPIGWALPGGHVDYGEPLDAAAVREVREETGLSVELAEQFFTYSDPRRDPRKHAITTVFLARGAGTPKGSDDADDARVFPLDALPSDLCFDHADILGDWRRYVETGARRKL